MLCTFLLQNVPPAILLRFLREHRSEWADNNIDAYAAAAVKVGPCSLQGSRVGNFGGQVILPLAHTVEHEEVNDLILLLQLLDNTLYQKLSIAFIFIIFTFVLLLINFCVFISSWRS